MTKTKGLLITKLLPMAPAQRRASAARSATLPKTLTLKRRILINRTTISLMAAIETAQSDIRINIIIGLAEEETIWARELSMI